MSKLWRYELQGDFSGENAGNCQWAIGEWEGREYFIKEFLTPKYPVDTTDMSPKTVERKKKACEDFVVHKERVYRVAHDSSDGNSVPVLELFRYGTKYYTVQPLIHKVNMSIEDVAALPMGEKRRICANIAHSVSCFHDFGMIHSDIKHDNILFIRTKRDTLVPKLIDFDSAFFEQDPTPETIDGDAVYFSPEVLLRQEEEDLSLNCKMDIFALGVLFHQYLTGRLPGFDETLSGTVGEAVMQGLPLELSTELDPEVQVLLDQMLLRDPAARPSAEEVYRTIRPLFEETVRIVPESRPEPKPEPKPESKPSKPKTEPYGGANAWFHPPEW